MEEPIVRLSEYVHCVACGVAINVKEWPTHFRDHSESGRRRIEEAAMMLLHERPTRLDVEERR